MPGSGGQASLTIHSELAVGNAGLKPQRSSRVQMPKHRMLIQLASKYHLDLIFTIKINHADKPTASEITRKRSRVSHGNAPSLKQ